MTKDTEISIHSSISEISENDWDRCARGNGSGVTDLFLQHRFLLALEASGSVGGDTGWLPHPMSVKHGDDIIAVAPLYLKLHSQGEYIFDHGWADALERAGGRYYPKLQCAVPFTPVTGRRLLARAGYEELGARALLSGIAQLTSVNGLSSAHLTFCTEDEQRLAEAEGFLPRLTQQFHWVNDDYISYEAFLASLTSRKRKALRKERAQAQDGVEIRQLVGDAIQPEHWDAFWVFYQDTGARKWGQPYLTRAFFEALHAMRDQILLVFAYREGRPIAGALNMIGEDVLHGRYWGCTEDRPFLHFELCYHQAIDYAISHGLKRVEAGAQGEHKLARGYLPTPTYSAHFITNPSLRDAIGRFLAAERAATGEDIEVLTEMGPFRSQGRN
ncbi:GNAT family N-acetyltransferase [Albirhodobacter sp. R86504]|uniref:GNAT family N-acetyltransferase n=1 Tax=Albirhodobacter sp. R86504 TaxID=3093848 RepID=UPI00367036E8